MPELPEVQTTVNGIYKKTKGYTVVDVWTDYNSPSHAEKNNIKNPAFFKEFKKKISGAKVIGCSRRAKNILIHLSNQYTILIHMKMTGHMMFGQYSYSSSKKKDPWSPTIPDPKHPLNDSFNQHIHLVFTLSKHSSSPTPLSPLEPKHLVLSDMRKFAKVTLIETKHLEASPDLSHLGPEPLEEQFTYNIFVKRFEKRGKAPIKQVILDQSLISGIGNIYSDEILWAAGVHPESRFLDIPQPQRKKMFLYIKEILKKGIDFGGDSMSDYRNIDGLPGAFQGQHKAYRKTKSMCEKKGCTGTILRMVIGGRSSHFCSKHQILYGS
jgi:formamidopyrimidine-DNA glycosylase